LIGFLVAKPLGLEARPLSRTAYYVLVPAFVFDVLSRAELSLGESLAVLGYGLAIQLAAVLLAFVTARALRRPRDRVAAIVLLVAFPNVGNFGFPILEFHLGPEVRTLATLYFLVMMTSGFAIGVAAAAWVKGGRLGAVLAVLRTPAIAAVIPALLVNLTDLPLPLAASRITGMLGVAMVPIMLVTLGVQIRSMERSPIGLDMGIAAAVRLLGGPLLAVALAIPFALSGPVRDVGIIQAAMPSAVLTGLIAIEHDLLPQFVTSTVLFTTLASVATLTVVLALL
jgi:predicted permease